MAEDSHDDALLKVLVVDDHPIVREAIAAMLRDAGYAVFEADSGERAVNTAATLRPQLVVMDVLMPGMSGIEATERIIAQDPAVRVLMLSMADSAETIRAAVKAGAAGYLTKTAASTASLLDALRRTAAGERVFVPAGIIDALVQEPGQLPQPTGTQLTLREREIVALAAQGAANSAIATALKLSPRTVENHLARIYRKLDISSRTQLAKVAIEQPADRYPWAGQTCTIMATDIAAFAGPERSDSDRMALRRAMHEVLRDTFNSSGIPWPACHVEDRGDGLLIIVPPGVPASSFMDPCLRVLTDNLIRHNRVYDSSLNIQLRVALDVGPVTADELGVAGTTIIRAARLLDSRPLKETLLSSNGYLAVIFSEHFYNTVITEGHLILDSTALRSVDIDVKETKTTAWMWPKQITRRGPHARQQRARSGWDSLTPTEVKIAVFVEEGLSNPEIAARLLLSRRTVATHVSHILKKLDVNSRIDIARESALRTLASEVITQRESQAPPDRTMS